MPKGKSHGPSIKDDRQYEALREQGASKEKAARIANASSNSSRSAGRRGGKAADYDDQTVDQLRRRAAEIGIEGRSKMRKAELIALQRLRTPWSPLSASRIVRFPQASRGLTEIATRI